MKEITLLTLSFCFLISFSSCEKAPPLGHLKLSITYPEAVVDNGTISFTPVPGTGAEARMYDKGAVCLGYKDAMLNLVKIDDEYATSIYMQISNELGIISFNDIPAGEYLLIIYAEQLNRYTEKNIEIVGGDTLALSKKFTYDIALSGGLEPWDYEIPGY